MEYFKKEFFNKDGLMLMDYFDVDGLTDQTMNGTGDSDGHALILFSIALSIKAKTIIELGVRDGCSTAPLLLAAQKLNGKLYSVDIKPSWFGVSKNLCPYWDFYTSDSIKFLNEWDKAKPIDLIFIDNLHTYEHVANELKVIETLIAPNTVVLLHDTMYNNSQPKYHIDVNSIGQWMGGGPARAVKELDLNIWEYATIPSCNGLTILRLRGE